MARKKDQVLSIPEGAIETGLALERHAGTPLSIPEGAIETREVKIIHEMRTEFFQYPKVRLRPAISERMEPPSDAIRAVYYQQN